jgi:hypothetical protein
MPTYRRHPFRLHGPLLLVALTLQLHAPSVAGAIEAQCPGGASPLPSVIWCDDFDDGTPLRDKYFEYDDDAGDFVPVPGVGVDGSVGMRVVWQPGEVSAGSLKRTFGRSPVNSQSHSTLDFREIYWRQYLRMAPGWTGNPDKLSRATILATPNWAQAMIAHLWGSGDYLLIDPASGTDPGGTLVTTTFNDFDHLRWLGSQRGVTPIFSAAESGKWHCVEAHVTLNAPGSSDGVFEFWIDGRLEARRAALNWVGDWQSYGINAVFFENYWNAGAPGERRRYLDNLAISTTRIGCLDAVAPSPPRNLQVR